MNKIFLIDKKEGISSYDVIRDLKHKLHTTSIGHCGTLDPFASGLLIILVGEATKISDYMMGEDKTYVGELKLGISTDSYDKDGNIIETRDVNNISIDDIKNVFNKFIGKQTQIPPMYSAIKKDGKKMYELARKGIKVDIEPRDIEIYSLELLGFNNNIIKFKAKVSKGTYIRSLGVDIAFTLNTIGHLISLRRIRCGKNDISNAINIEDVEESKGYDIKDCLDIRQVNIEQSLIKDGKRIKLDYDDKYILLLDNKSNKELAIYVKDGLEYKCKRGFNL